MAQQIATVHTLNPRKKRRAKPKGKKKVAKKTTKRKRRAPARKAVAAPVKRRRRRASTKNPAPRRSRRSAGSSIAKAMTFSGGLKGLGGRMAGKFVVSYVSQQYAIRFSGAGSLLPGGGAFTSSYRGQSWTLGQYIASYVGLQVACRLMSKMKNSSFATEMFQGGFDTLATKLIWTEGFSRVPMLQQTFGATIERDDGGNTWMRDGDQWNSMGDVLEEAGPLDGMGDVLEEAGPLDGTHYNQSSSFMHSPMVSTGNPYHDAYN
jgi:hypothetical protein